MGYTWGGRIGGGGGKGKSKPPSEKIEQTIISYQFDTTEFFSCVLYHIAASSAVAPTPLRRLVVVLARCRARPRSRRAHHHRPRRRRRRPGDSYEYGVNEVFFVAEMKHCTAVLLTQCPPAPPPPPSASCRPWSHSPQRSVVKYIFWYSCEINRECLMIRPPDPRQQTQGGGSKMKPPCVRKTFLRWKRKQEELWDVYEESNILLPRPNGIFMVCFLISIMSDLKRYLIFMYYMWPRTFFKN